MSKSKSKNAVMKPATGFALAAAWPVYEVLLSRNWAEQGAIITVLIARRSPNTGKIAVASLLVDLACLGAKSVQVASFRDVPEYRTGLRSNVMQIQPMEPASFNLAAKIVLTGVAYAASLGFKPDPVYNQAAHLLVGADPAAEPTVVPTGGEDGKPVYIQGPNDDPRRIVDQLTRAVGEGNFHYVLRGGDDMFDLIDDFDDDPDDPDDAPDTGRLRLLRG